MFGTAGQRDHKFGRAIPSRHTMNGSKLKNVKIFLDTNIRKSDASKESAAGSKVRKNDDER